MCDMSVHHYANYPMQSPVQYELNSPYSTASTASSFLTDSSPVDQSYDPLPSPDDHVYYAPFDQLDCAGWSADVKKHQFVPRQFANPYQIKPTLYIPPPVPPNQRHQHVQIHSPLPVRQQHPVPVQDAQVFDPEDWQSQQYPVPHPHYDPSPHIKQEDLAAFPSYPSSHYESSASPQHLVPSHPIIPAFDSPQEYYQSQSQSPQHVSEPRRSNSFQQLQQQQQYPGTTVHPAEVSPIESAASPFTDLAACDPRYVSQQQQQQQQHQQGVAGLAPDWADTRRSSLEALERMSSMDLGMDSSVAVVPGMSVIVGMEEAVGASTGADEQDADGEEEWDQNAIVSQQYIDEEVDRESDSDRESSSRARQGRSESEEDYEESESEEVDDDDDDEFVLSPRRSPTKRRGPTAPAVPSSLLSGSYPADDGLVSYAMGEGRSLRPRGSSTRYNPYPYSDAPYYTDDLPYPEHDGLERKRFNSTSSASPSLSSQGDRSARRRVRPSPNLPVPVPIPNLTKKSRGRRVPTMDSIEDLRSAASGAGRKRQNAGGRTARMYLCDVEGCGKCFARGEHLKRHVRSIHTYEKPHKCPYPGCGKDFSRHDNLGQHMRVHKDFVPPPSAAALSAAARSSKK